MGIIEDTFRKLIGTAKVLPPVPAPQATSVVVTTTKAAPPAPRDPPWLKWARLDMGLREGIGAANTARIIQMFAKAGHPEVKSDATAWCAAAVGCWLVEAGLKGTGTLWALDYSKWGVALPGPALGCIAVKERKNSAGMRIGGHVGLVAGYDAKTIWLLAGNQSDMVKIAAYDRKTAGFSYRWPANVALPDYVPGAVASVGDKAGSEA